jgi:hypothetical protein
VLFESRLTVIQKRRVRQFSALPQGDIVARLESFDTVMVEGPKYRTNKQTFKSAALGINNEILFNQKLYFNY